MIDFDTMLIHVGEFGLYQKILFLVQAPFCFFVTWLLFGQVFIFLYPRVYWCEDRCLNFTGLTREQSRNLTIPFIDEAFDYCQTFNVNEETYTNFVTEARQSCGNRCAQDRHIPCEFNARTPSCRQIHPGNLENMIRRKRQSFPYGGGGGWTKNPDYNGGEPSNWGGRPGFNPYPQWPPATTNQPRTVQPTSQGRWPTPQPQSPNVPTTTEMQMSNRRQRPNRIPGGDRSPQSQRNTCPRNQTTSISTTELQPRICTKFPEGNRCIRNLPNNTLINAQNLTDRWSTNSNGLRPCESWAYRPDNLEYQTIVSEMGWWCNPETWITIASALFFVGAIVGGIGIGYIADNRGRLPALVTANLLGCIGGTLSAIFYENYILFCVFRFISGMGFDNCFTMIYILVLEYVGPTYRTIAANLSIAIFYTMGTLFLPLLAYVIKDWRYFTMAISLPMLFAVIVIFFVPESARWLISQGRIKEATKIIRSFAKVNGKDVDEALFVEFEQTANEVFEESKKEKKVTFLDGLKKPRIAKNFILLATIWSLIALVYNGHSRNILNLGENPFILFAVASSTEFPADMLLIFTLDRFGRRWLAFLSLTLSGVFSVVGAVIPVNMTTALLVMALLSRFWVNVSLNIGLQYAAELLPTVIRAQGVNTIHIMGNVASIISPIVSSLGRSNPVLAGMILGVSAIAGGVLSLFLPESLGEDLPNTLEDGEVFGKDQSFWNCPICTKRKPEEEEKPSVEVLSNVEIRNRMRASIRGETYRSSIISGSSKRSTPAEAIHLLPGGSLAVLRSNTRNHRYTT